MRHKAVGVEDDARYQSPGNEPPSPRNQRFEQRPRHGEHPQRPPECAENKKTNEKHRNKDQCGQVTATRTRGSVALQPNLKDK